MNSFRRPVMARKFTKIATLIGVTAFLAQGAVASDSFRSPARTAACALAITCAWTSRMGVRSACKEAPRRAARLWRAMV
jgi:hypothetical protein